MALQRPDDGGSGLGDGSFFFVRVFLLKKTEKTNEGNSFSCRFLSLSNSERGFLCFFSDCLFFVFILRTVRCFFSLAP